MDAPCRVGSVAANGQNTLGRFSLTLRTFVSVPASRTGVLVSLRGACYVLSIERLALSRPNETMSRVAAVTAASRSTTSTIRMLPSSLRQ